MSLACTRQVQVDRGRGGFGPIGSSERWRPPSGPSVRVGSCGPDCQGDHSGGLGGYFGPGLDRPGTGASLEPLLTLDSWSLVLGGKHDGPLCLPPPWAPWGIVWTGGCRPNLLHCSLSSPHVASIPQRLSLKAILSLCAVYLLFFRCFSRATRPVVLSWVLAGGASVSCLAWVPFPCSKPPAIHQAIKSINQRSASCWLSPYPYIHSYTRIHKHTQAYTSSSIQPPHRPSSLVVRGAASIVPRLRPALSPVSATRARFMTRGLWADDTNTYSYILVPTSADRGDDSFKPALPRHSGLCRESPCIFWVGRPLQCQGSYLLAVPFV